MKKKQTSKLEQFELLTETSTGSLIGGFSTTLFLEIDPIDGGGTTNNCNGGNCVAGCGSGSTVNKFICG